MKYQFAALFADQSLLSSVAARIPAARLCQVNERWAIVPLPRLLVRGMGKVEPGFRLLVRGVAVLAQEASHQGPITWLEADFDGGIGTQCAVLWHQGQEVAGPFFAGDRVRPPLSLADWPINRALRTMGVEAAPGRDEYDTLRLGRYRKLEQWLEADVPAFRARSLAAPHASRPIL